MNQTLTNTRSLEERVYQRSRFGGGYQLDKGRYTLALPKLVAMGAAPDKRPHMKIAAKLDNTIDLYYDLIGENNLTLRTGNSTIGSEVISLNYHNIDLERPLYENTKVFWGESEILPDMGFIQYNQNDELTVNIRGPLGDMAELLLGTKVAVTHNEEEFETLVNDIQNALDNLFVKQNIEPTIKAKHNLIGLFLRLPAFILAEAEIQNLLDTDIENHSINNPSLIRLAAKGVNYGFVQNFYFSRSYPESVEEMLELVDIPLDMLCRIWSMKQGDTRKES